MPKLQCHGQVQRIKQLEEVLPQEVLSMHPCTSATTPLFKTQSTPSSALGAWRGPLYVQQPLATCHKKKKQNQVNKHHMKNHKKRTEKKIVDEISFSRYFLQGISKSFELMYNSLDTNEANEET